MKNIRVYIDADNISHRQCDNLLTIIYEIEGRIQSISVYGDYCESEAKNWKQKSLDNNFNMVMAPRYNGSKDSSDMKIAVDVISSIYESPDVNIYIIISNDTDFIPLINKLKEKGKIVIGIGTSQSSNKILQKSYDKFVSLDLRFPEVVERRDSSNNTYKRKITRRVLEKNIYTESIKIIEDLFDRIGDFRACYLNDQLQRRFPSFDCKNYGFSNFSNFAKYYYERKYKLLFKKGCGYKFTYE
jgi:uncharacterized protein (TIGR00288 family)